MTENPEPKPALIPASFYAAQHQSGSAPPAPPPADSPPPMAPPGGGSGRIPPGPSAFGWWRKVPGFRTGTRWKQLVAILGYLIIAAWIVQIPTRPALGMLGFLSLAAVWLASNAFGLRTKVPVFRSANRLAAAGVWTALAIAIFVTAALAQPPASNPNTGVGTGPSVSPSPSSLAQAISPSPATQPSAAATPSPSPKPSPTPSPTPSPSPAPPSQTSPPPVAFNFCGAPSNPWDYNFCSTNIGKYIYNPGTDICSYFNCIASFWQSTNGYVDECNDGTYSHSGGRSGACSHHGGEMRPLWD